MELRSLTPENFEALERLRKRYEETLTAILRRGAADGVFDVPDPAVTTRALIAMLTGLTTWFRDGGRLTRDEIADLYWPMVRGAVRPG
jgi:hypothetical protein